MPRGPTPKSNFYDGLGRGRGRWAAAQLLDEPRNRRLLRMRIGPAGGYGVALTREADCSDLWALAKLLERRNPLTAL